MSLSSFETFTSNELRLDVTVASEQTASSFLILREEKPFDKTTAVLLFFYFIIILAKFSFSSIVPNLA